MAKLPLINRKSPVKLLDTDLIEVNRRLPSGEILALRINIADISYKTKLPEINFFSEGVDLTKELRSELNYIPILPSKSCYGAKKHVGGQTLWINNSFDIDLTSLNLLKEAASDSKEVWYAERGTDEKLADVLATVWTDYATELDGVAKVLDSIQDVANNELNSYKIDFPSIDVSCLEKYNDNITKLKAIVDDKGKEALDIADYIQNGPKEEEKK